MWNNLVRYARRKFFQLKNGFDPRDCWNLDKSLAAWLAPRLKHLSETSHGFSPQYESFEAWASQLSGTAAVLQKYGDADFYDDEVNYDAVQDAIKWVADNFLHLWD